jgi:ferredoxin-NADP reductase
MSLEITEQTRPSGPKRVSLKLTDRRHEYGEVYTYSFVAAEPLPYCAGQYVHVVLELPDPDAKRVRELSFCSAPHETQIMFAIDGHSGSPYQRAFQALQPGDSVQLFKSKQHMLWPVIENCVVFIAGGIGITPFRSMCLDKQHSQVRMRVEIIHAASGPKLFRTELEPIADAYHATDRSGLAGEVTAVIARQPEARYYIAGSPGFVEGVNTMLLEGGISPKKIHLDEFKGYVEE